MSSNYRSKDAESQVNKYVIFIEENGTIAKKICFDTILIMESKNILHLILKHNWFDKIVSGEKTSEYRECSDYWNKRLINKHYDTVVFHKGYTNVNAVYKIVSIDITTAKNDLNLPKCWEIKLKK